MSFCMTGQGSGCLAPLPVIVLQFQSPLASVVERFVHFQSSLKLPVVSRRRTMRSLSVVSLAPSCLFCFHPFAALSRDLLRTSPHSVLSTLHGIPSSLHFTAFHPLYTSLVRHSASPSLPPSGDPTPCLTCSVRIK
jgi:hypothetical protein